MVQRTDLDLWTDAAARQLAYADNRAAEVGIEWAAEPVASDLAAGVTSGRIVRPCVVRQANELQQGTGSGCCRCTRWGMTVSGCG